MFEDTIVDRRILSDSFGIKTRLAISTSDTSKVPLISYEWMEHWASTGGGRFTRNFEDYYDLNEFNHLIKLKDDDSTEN